MDQQQQPQQLSTLAGLTPAEIVAATMKMPGAFSNKVCISATQDTVRVIFLEEHGALLEPRGCVLIPIGPFADFIAQGTNFINAFGEAVQAAADGAAAADPRVDPRLAGRADGQA
jgi:hypothetical protein